MTKIGSWESNRLCLHPKAKKKKEQNYRHLFLLWPNRTWRRPGLPELIKSYIPSNIFSGPDRWIECLLQLRRLKLFCQLQCLCDRRFLCRVDWEWVLCFWWERSLAHHWDSSGIFNRAYFRGHILTPRTAGSRAVDVKMGNGKAETLSCSLWTLLEEQRNQEIFRFEKLKTENLDFFLNKNYWKRLIDYRNICRLT